MKDTRFISIELTARRLGVPAGWLRREAKAGRIPVIKAGRLLLLEPEMVERVLLERAKALQDPPTPDKQGVDHE